MSFYSYKNANQESCPSAVCGDATTGLSEKVCVQLKKVYDSCLQQIQLNNRTVTVTQLCGITDEGDVPPVITPPITFESCRSSDIHGTIRNLVIERMCDRPNFARVRCTIDIPVDILFVDSKCVEGIAKGVISVNKDVLLFVPDESIVPFTLETLVSAICVSGTYVGCNEFQITVCVTIIMKIVAEVELLIPSYGFCPVPPCEEFSENVCDEFFNLPIFPQQPVCTCGTPNGHCGCGGR